MVVVYNPAGPAAQLANFWWVLRACELLLHAGCQCTEFLLRTAPPFPCSPSAPVVPSFLMSALVSADILLIRFFLCLAYIWLLVNASLGVPRWPAMDSTGGISVDGITWWAVAVACTTFGGGGGRIR